MSWEARAHPAVNRRELHNLPASSAGPTIDFPRGTPAQSIRQLAHRPSRVRRYRRRLVHGVGDYILPLVLPGRMEQSLRMSSEHGNQSKLHINLAFDGQSLEGSCKVKNVTSANHCKVWTKSNSSSKPVAVDRITSPKNSRTEF